MHILRTSGQDIHHAVGITTSASIAIAKAVNGTPTSLQFTKNDTARLLHFQLQKKFSILSKNTIQL